MAGAEPGGRRRERREIRRDRSSLDERHRALVSDLIIHESELGQALVELQAAGEGEGGRVAYPIVVEVQHSQRIVDLLATPWWR